MSFGDNRDRLLNGTQPVSATNPLPVTDSASETSLISIDSKTIPLTITEELTITNYNLQSVPYSATTNIAQDYILDNIEFIFTTNENKIINILSPLGTNIIPTITTTETSLFLGQIATAFKANSNITVNVSQTTGACLMNMVLRIKKGNENSLITGSTIENTLEQIAGQMASRVDNQTTYFYIGTAQPGSLDANTVWQIQKIDLTSNPYTFKWASSNTNFDKIWNNRGAYTYG